MIERFEKFSLAISEISHYWHSIATEELQPYGLKSSHAIYLTTMYRYPDGLTAPMLADLCARDKADVSRMMSIMEKKGLIIKEGNGPKMYRGILKLTDEGRVLAGKINQRAELAVQQASQGLSDEKRLIFYDALDTITANLQRIAKEGL